MLQEELKIAEKFYNTVPKLGARVKAGGLLSRRLLTGAGYEAGVEGRHHIDALHSELVSAEEAKLGRPLTDNETADLYDLSNASGNGVFAANLALVGVGNFIAFPKLFGPGFGTAARSYGKVLKDASTGKFKSAYDTWNRA